MTQASALVTRQDHYIDDPARRVRRTTDAKHRILNRNLTDNSLILNGDPNRHETTLMHSVRILQELPRPPVCPLIGRQLGVSLAEKLAYRHLIVQASQVFGATQKEGGFFILIGRKAEGENRR